MELEKLLTVTFTLFAVIDIIGSIPLLITLKEKMGGIRELAATLISGALMILFMLVGEKFLSVLGLDTGIYKMKLYPLLPLIFIAAYIFVGISIAFDTPGLALIATGVFAAFLLIYFIVRSLKTNDNATTAK